MDHLPKDAIFGYTTSNGMNFLMETSTENGLSYKEPCAISQVRLADGGVGISLQPLLMFAKSADLVSFITQNIMFVWEPDERMKAQYREVCQTLAASRAGLVTAQKTPANSVILKG